MDVRTNLLTQSLLNIAVLIAACSAPMAHARHSELVFAVAPYSNPTFWLHNPTREVFAVSRFKAVEIRCSRIDGFLPNIQGSRYRHAIQTELHEQGANKGHLFVDTHSQVAVVEGDGASVSTLRAFWQSRHLSEAALRRHFCAGSEAIEQRIQQATSGQSDLYSGETAHRIGDVSQRATLEPSNQAWLPAGWTVTYRRQESSRVRVPFSTISSGAEDLSCERGLTENTDAEQRAVYLRAFAVETNPFNALVRRDFCRSLKAREAHNAGYQCGRLFAREFQSLETDFVSRREQATRSLADISDFCVAGFAAAPRPFVAASRHLPCDDLGGLDHALHPSIGDFSGFAPSASTLLQALRATDWTQRVVQDNCHATAPAPMIREGSPTPPAVVPRVAAPSTGPVDMDLRFVQVSLRKWGCPVAPIPGAASIEVGHFSPLLDLGVARRARRWRQTFPALCALATPYVAPSVDAADTDIYRARRYLCGIALLKRQSGGETGANIELDDIFDATSEDMQRAERLVGAGGLPRGETCFTYSPKI